MCLLCIHTKITGLHLHYGDLTDSSSLVKLISEVSLKLSWLYIQWNLRIKDTWGPEQVSFIRRCPLFGAYFIAGSTVYIARGFTALLVVGFSVFP